MEMKVNNLTQVNLLERRKIRWPRDEFRMILQRKARLFLLPERGSQHGAHAPELRLVG